MESYVVGIIHSLDAEDYRLQYYMQYLPDQKKLEFVIYQLNLITHEVLFYKKYDEYEESQKVYDSMTDRAVNI